MSPSDPPAGDWPHMMDAPPEPHAARAAAL
jgi:hypothetical protein